MNREGDKYGNAKEKGSGAILIQEPLVPGSARNEALETHSTTCRNTISRKRKLLKDLEYIDPLSMDYQPTHHKTLLTVEELRLGYEKIGYLRQFLFNKRRRNCWNNREKWLRKIELDSVFIG